MLQVSQKLMIYLKKCGFGLLKRVFVKKEISIFSLGVPAIFIKNIFLVQL